MNSLTRLGVAAGTVLLGLGLAAPAHAGSYTYQDKASDVWAYTCTYPTSGDEGATCSDARDSTVTEGDVIASSVQHRDRKVILRTRYRELTRGEDFHVQMGEITTNEGLRRGVNVVYLADEGSIFSNLFRSSGSVSCSLGHTVDFTANVVEVRIPRTCLSRPRWIQARLGHLRFAYTQFTAEDGTPMETEVKYYDDAHSGYHTTGKLSPRIYRG